MRRRPRQRKAVWSNPGGLRLFLVLTAGRLPVLDHPEVFEGANEFRSLTFREIRQLLHARTLTRQCGKVNVIDDFVLDWSAGRRGN